MYRRYIDNEKRDYNTRILSINANRMRCKDDKKIHQLIDFCKQNNINIALLTETNTKQIIVKESIIRKNKQIRKKFRNNSH